MYNMKAVHFYTGLESFEKFLFVYDTLGPAAEQLKYIYGKPPEHISPLNRFFLTLIVLRRRKVYYELSLMFGTTEKQIMNIFITWIRFMHLSWKEVHLWPSRELVQFYAPADFKKKYPTTRIILDGTEIKMKKPDSPVAQQGTYSSYKNGNTVYTCVGSTPGGLTSYVSRSYGGSISDRMCVQISTDLLEKLDPGDSVMADKGFDIEDILAAYRVTLNIPTFFKERNQITPFTLKQDRKIASKRVHIERIIGLAKTFKILRGPLDGTETLLADDIIFVSFMLCNFRKTIVHKYA